MFIWHYHNYDCKEIQPVYPKGNQSWIFLEGLMLKLNSNTLATWCKELTHCHRPWCWERLKAGGEGDDRGWDVWMASLTQWTWVWENSGSWWWTGRPGMLRSMGSQKVGHNWATELNWKWIYIYMLLANTIIVESLAWIFSKSSKNLLVV